MRFNLYRLACIVLSTRGETCCSFGPSSGSEAGVLFGGGGGGALGCDRVTRRATWLKCCRRSVKRVGRGIDRDAGRLMDNDGSVEDRELVGTQVG